jgi:phage terminase large subunit-like protein
VVVAKLDDNRFGVIPFAFLAAVGLRDKARLDRVPYDQWVDKGWLFTTPGRTVNKRAVLTFLMHLCTIVDVRAMPFDRWRIDELKTYCEEVGVKFDRLKLEPFGQGFRDMSPAVDRFEDLVLSGGVVHNGSPVLNWCIANAAVERDPAGNRKLTKAKARGRIDALVAAVQAVGWWNKAPVASKVRILPLGVPSGVDPRDLRG